MSSVLFRIRSSALAFFFSFCSDLHHHGSDTALCPPSAGTAEASSIARRGSTSELGYIARGGSLLSIGARARKSARTHAPAGCGGGGVLVVPAPSSLSPRAVSARGPAAARARAARGGDAPRRYARRIAHASSARRARTSGRTWGWCFPAPVPRRTALPARRAVTVRSGRTQSLRLSTQNPSFPLCSDSLTRQ